MIRVDWIGGVAFKATPPSGSSFVMDLPEDEEGLNRGPTPLEALLSAAAACSAIDVVLVLQKKRLHIESYRVEVEWTRGPEGVYPRPITSIVIRHILKGDLSEAAVKHAVELSDEKYCTVIYTLRQPTDVRSEFHIEP